jgi:hypothetical protein
MSLRDSVGDLFDIRLARTPAREHTADLNNEYKSDRECCEAPKPLIPQAPGSSPIGRCAETPDCR